MKTRATADNLAVAVGLWELSRLWRNGWFTEGLDTPELREADALLDELD